MKEEIRVCIGPDGTALFTVAGAEGSRCLSVTQFFEREVGRVIDRKRTRSFYTNTHASTVHTLSCTQEEKDA